MEKAPLLLLSYAKHLILTPRCANACLHMCPAELRTPHSWTKLSGEVLFLVNASVQNLNIDSLLNLKY